jgi:hypothetical protein
MLRYRGTTPLASASKYSSTSGGDETNSGCGGGGVAGTGVGATSNGAGVPSRGTGVSRT